MVVVWIASTLLETKSIKYLRYAIESALALNIDNIILSIYTNQDISHIRHPKLDIRRRNVFLTIFEHYELLVEEAKFDTYYKSNPWIIFLDDQDLLMNNIIQYTKGIKDAIIATQYVTINKQYDILIDMANQVSILDIDAYIEVNKDEIMIVDDISGTAVKYLVIREYFNFKEKHPSLFNNKFGYIYFLKYLINIGIKHTKIPVAIQRIIPENNNSIDDNVVNIRDILVDNYADMKRDIVKLRDRTTKLKSQKENLEKKLKHEKSKNRKKI